MIRRLFLLAIFSALLVAPRAALADQAKLALVIANSDYDLDGSSSSPDYASAQKGFVTDLRNPRNDAKAMSTTLRRLGFDVSTVVDADRGKMVSQLADFGQRVADAPDDAIVVIFYSGHGIQVNGVNFLIPAGARIPPDMDVSRLAPRQAETQLGAYAVPINMLFDQLRSRARGGLNLVIIDACRDNPWDSRFFGGNRGVARRGLAEQVPSFARTLIAYSTTAGESASDGAGANSPYTEALLRWIGRPGLTVLQMLNSVGLDVVTATGQTPWLNNAPLEDICLAGCRVEAAGAPAIARPAAREPAPQPVAGTVIRESAAPPPHRPRPASAGNPFPSGLRRVALLVPLSGANAGLGKSFDNAANLAILDTHSSDIGIVTYDTGGAGGATAAWAKAKADGAELVLGPLLSDEATQIRRATRPGDPPLLSFTNDRTAAGNGVFVMGVEPRGSMERVVQFALASGVRNFCGLIPEGVYGERVMLALQSAVEAGGGRVSAIGRFGGDIAAAVRALRPVSGCQAMLVAGNVASAIEAAPAIRGRWPEVRLLGPDLWRTDSTVASNALLNGAWFAAPSDNYYRQFAVKYRERFGQAPYRVATLSYDAVLLTVRLMKQSGAGDFARNLQSPSGYAGIDGAFRFDMAGVAERRLEVREIRSGSVVVVSPAPVGFN